MHVITHQNQPLVRDRQKESQIKSPVSDVQAGPMENTESPARTLGRGLAGDDVRKLQEQLRDAGHSLKIDGIFGPETEGALKAFQAKSGIKEDGLAGPQTFGALSNERGREFTEQSAPRATMPASKLPGQAVSARDVLQAMKSSGGPQSVLQGGLPNTNSGTTPTESDDTALGLATMAVAGAGALALAKRPANFKGVLGGDHVATAAQKLQTEANRTGRAQKFDFQGKGGTTLIAKPGDSVEKILEPYAQKNKVSAQSLIDSGKTDAFRQANSGQTPKSVDAAYRKGVNEHLLKETGDKSIKLKPGQTLSDLEGKLTGNVMKGAREAGDSAVEALKKSGSIPKSVARSAEEVAAKSVDATYRKGVNEHLLKETGDKSIKLKPGQTLSDLNGKVTGNVLKGARQAGDAAVESMPKATNVAKSAANAVDDAAAKGASKGATKVAPSMLKIGGRALVVGSVAMDAVDLNNAHNADKLRGDGKSTEVKATAAGIGLSWGGAIAGAKVGAMGAARFGLIAGPKGAAVAGVVGGVVGAIVGSMAGDSVGANIRASDAAAARGSAGGSTDGMDLVPLGIGA